MQACKNERLHFGFWASGRDESFSGERLGGAVTPRPHSNSSITLFYQSSSYIKRAKTRRDLVPIELSIKQTCAKAIMSDKREALGDFVGFKDDKKGDNIRAY